MSDQNLMVRNVMKEIILVGYSSGLLSAWWRKSDGYGESRVSLWFSVSLFVCSLDLCNIVLSLERHWQGLRPQEVLCYTVTTRMISVLGWVAMRATFMFDSLWGAGSQDVSINCNFWGERRAELGIKLLSSAYQPNALPPRQIRSPWCNVLVDWA